MEVNESDEADDLDCSPLNAGSSGPSGSMWQTTMKRIPIQLFTGPVEGISSPIEVFDLFFSPDLMDEIVKQSNAHAETENMINV